ncbi:MAG: hypothetical protein U1F66_01860 [bacterium]
MLLGLTLAASARAQLDPELGRAAAGLGTSPALQALLRRSAEGGASREFVLGVLQDAQQMQAQGLPTEAYLLKANEGLAKRVPPPKILPVLQESRAGTARAASWVDAVTLREGRRLSPRERQGAILGLQRALLNGASPGELEKAARGAGSWQELEGQLPSWIPRRHPVIEVKLPRAPLLNAPPSGPVQEKIPPGQVESREKPLHSGKKAWKKSETLEVPGRPGHGDREDGREDRKEKEEDWKERGRGKGKSSGEGHDFDRGHGKKRFLL